MSANTRTTVPDVARNPSAQLSAATIVSITPQGIEMLALADTAWSEAQTRVTQLRGPEAQGTLDTWLDNLASQDQ